MQVFRQEFPRLRQFRSLLPIQGNSQGQRGGRQSVQEEHPQGAQKGGLADMESSSKLQSRLLAFAMNCSRQHYGIFE